MEFPALINFMANYGIMLVIISILLFFGYKYLNIKFKILEENLRNELKPHYWEVSGSVSEAETENGSIKNLFFTVIKKYED